MNMRSDLGKQFVELGAFPVALQRLVGRGEVDVEELREDHAHGSLGRPGRLLQQQRDDGLAQGVGQTHFAPAIGRQRVLARHAAEHHSTAANSAVDLLEERVAAAHLRDVHPAREAGRAQSRVERLHFGLLAPLIRDEDVGTLLFSLKKIERLSLFLGTEQSNL